MQGVSYYEQEITVDLFDQLEWKSSGVNTPLVCRSLIDAGVLFHTHADDNDRSLLYNSTNYYYYEVRTHSTPTDRETDEQTDRE